MQCSYDVVLDSILNFFEFTDITSILLYDRQRVSKGSKEQYEHFKKL